MAWALAKSKSQMADYHQMKCKRKWKYK